MAAELLQFFISVLAREDAATDLTRLEEMHQGGSGCLTRFVHVGRDVDDLELIEEIEVLFDKVGG